jgi:uncharacterized protein YkwD
VKLLRSLSIFFLFFIVTTASVIAQEDGENFKLLPNICLSETEALIFQKVNEYRLQHGLGKIPYSKSLTYVAQMHVKDLAYNHPVSRRCNLHSWSSHGPWKGCCYCEDHSNATCMWNKPRELTNYTGEGYEIAFWTNESLTPGGFAEKSLTGWKRSTEHNRVILNKSEWGNLTWNAMGVGYYEGFAVVWFGAIPDKEEELHVCEK